MYLAFFCVALGLFFVLFSAFSSPSGNAAADSMKLPGFSSQRSGEKHILTPKNGGFTETNYDEGDLPLVVSGVLFFNENRELFPEKGVTEKQLSGFSGLKRAGRGKLVIERGNFVFHCNNASYSYSASELERIEFQNKGLVLIPTRRERPFPTFITEDSESIRVYVKKHARYRG